jgi:DNA-binding LacI/PurR family transcriptional regulator
MAFYINVLIDEYSDNLLDLPALMQGVNESANQKKLPVRTFFSANELIKAFAKEKRRFVIVFSYSKNHSEKLLFVLQRHDIHPIFLNLRFSNTIYPFSSIIPNHYSSFYELIQTILEEQAEPTAFVGFNKDSTHDTINLEAFKRAVGERGVREYVFFNDGDVDKCLNNTISELPRLKNVFCTNDQIALLLMKKMKDTGLNPADFNITGFSNIKIGKYFKPSLTTIGLNKNSMGNLIVEAFVFLCKQNQVDGLHLSVKHEIIFRESTGLSIKASVDRQRPWNSGEVAGGMVDFYGDEPINKINIIESMFEKCDDKDLGILRDLLANKTYEELAENQELALNTVKYRLSKIENHLKVTNRKELYACLAAYDLSI